MRKIVLYTYHADEQRFSQTSNLMLEQDAVSLESRNEHELIFAISTFSTFHRTRISIASRPGLVYHDQDNALYRVWFDSPDRDKAIKAIGNYILDHIAPEIRMHQSFIKRLQDERDGAINTPQETTFRIEGLTDYIYVIQKCYVENTLFSYDLNPVGASDDYKTVVAHVKDLRDYILKHGDPELDKYDPSELVAWDGYNYYAVGSSDQTHRIIFKIKIAPKLITKKEQND